MEQHDRRSDMLDDPAISHQWVLRRLQKTLTADLAVAALVTGIRGCAGDRQREILDLAQRRTAERARLVRELIEHEGGAPYSSVGLARGTSRVGGWLLGLLGPWLWRPLLTRLAEQSYAAVDALSAFAHGAPGVSDLVGERIAPEVGRARELLARLRAA